MSGIELFFVEQGLLGILVLVLGWYVWSKEKALDRLRDKINAIQEQRIDDARAATNALNQNSNALDKLSTLVAELRRRDG